jgi:hypothetical protein
MNSKPENVIAPKGRKMCENEATKKPGFSLLLYVDNYLYISIDPDNCNHEPQTQSHKPTGAKHTLRSNRCRTHTKTVAHGTEYTNATLGVLCH